MLLIIAFICAPLNNFVCFEQLSDQLEYLSSQIAGETKKKTSLKRSAGVKIRFGEIWPFDFGTKSGKCLNFKNAKGA